MKATNQNLGNGDKPNEMPEKSEQERSQQEHIAYNPQTEHELENSGDENFSENIDVTPPTQHEFPSVGHAKTDFESRPHGRKTGRMIGHEPGTEGI